MKSEKKENMWQGGKRPMVASYGKLMMWFFLMTDALTFSAFLVAYGWHRFVNTKAWPVPDDVFTHFPFIHGEYPLFFVALMTFILIMSSVTMVLAVHHGHKMNKKGVLLWLGLTIIGGITFLGSQAWEWSHFIKGTHEGAWVTANDFIIHPIDKDKIVVGRSGPNGAVISDNIDSAYYMPPSPIKTDSLSKIYYAGKLKTERHLVTGQDLQDMIASGKAVKGATLGMNEYGHRAFGDFFFFITGFHGFHVFSGVIILIIIFINVLKNTYEKRGHYEMVEKVGLYWHFVDLVWVFVFTFFYLV